VGETSGSGDWVDPRPLTRARPGWSKVPETSAAGLRYHRRMGEEKGVFSEQELGEIVERAAELQEQSSERGLGYTPGVTLQQLERVAQEVGVEPEFLRRALEERREGVAGRRAGLLRDEERVVTGELDPADFDLVLAHVRVRRSRHRPATQIGRTLRAQVWTGSGLANLEVTSRNQRTRLRVKSFPLFEALGTLYPAFLASTMGALPLATAGHGLASALVGAGSVAAAALGFRFWLRRSNQAVTRLADQLAAGVAEELARPREGAARTTVENRGLDARHAATREKQDLK
jgi:hypothetical protein